MPFTAAQIEHYANMAIDFHADRGKVESQTIQDKPLLRDMRAAEKTFPGGKELITVRVKGEYSTQNQGFESDDTVDFADPGNVKTATFPYKLIHAGIKFSMHELIKDGISVVETVTGKETVEHSDRELTALAGIFEDKLEDMQEGSDRSMQSMYWQDGTQDPKVIPGIRSFILNSPSSAGLVAGLDPVVLTWWRNRANLAIDASTASNQNLVQALQKDFRQLRRYGSPKHKLYAGSDLMDAFEKELRSKGNYTMDGWAKGGNGRIDASVADLSFKGLALEYEPTLDDLGLSKYLYAIDTKSIYPMVVEGENWKKHSPARPHDKYVFYRAKTYVGGLVCKRRNTSQVWSIA